MKPTNLILILLIAIVAAAPVSVVAGPPQVGPVPRATLKVAGDLYECGKCRIANNMGGKCKGCGGRMMMLNANVKFECPKCKSTTSKAGKCTRCKVATVQKAISHSCDKCKTTSKEGGNCPRCKAKLKERRLTMKPEMK